MWGNNEL